MTDEAMCTAFERLVERLTNVELKQTALADANKLREQREAEARLRCRLRMGGVSHASGTRLARVSHASRTTPCLTPHPARCR